jgi:hypothetical protein
MMMIVSRGGAWRDMSKIGSNMNYYLKGEWNEVTNG